MSITTLMLGNSVLCLFAAGLMLLIIGKDYAKKRSVVRVLQYLYFSLLLLFSLYNGIAYIRYRFTDYISHIQFTSDQVISVISFVAVLGLIPAARHLFAQKKLTLNH